MINWNYINSRAAVEITEFKSKYIFSIGDLGTRSVCLALSTTLCYAAVAVLTKSTTLGKIRNAGLCLLANGLIWTPEMFNPFFVIPALKTDQPNK